MMPAGACPTALLWHAHPEHLSCAQGQILLTGRDFAASLGFALPSKELLSMAGLYGRAKWPWVPQGIRELSSSLGLVPRSSPCRWPCC